MYHENEELHVQLGLAGTEDYEGRQSLDQA